MFPLDPSILPIGFIGGGQMACALLGGLVRAGWPLKNIVVVEPHPPQQAVLREQLGVRVLARADASLQQASIVVWALKPDMVQAAANATVGFLADPLHLSIAAGVSLPDLVRCFGSSRVVRAMPNTPALVGAGVTGMLPAAGVSEADKALAEGVLSVAGRVFSVRSDEEMDAVTAISGSGPGYVFQFLESFQAAAEALGFDTAEAKQLVLDILAGSVLLAQSEDTEYAALRKRVTSKNGTTEAALNVLAERGFDAALHDAVCAAQQRALAMSLDISRNFLHQCNPAG